MAKKVTGIVNSGSGSMKIRNCAVGDGATVVVTNEDKEKKADSNKDKK